MNLKKLIAKTITLICIYNTSILVLIENMLIYTQFLQSNLNFKNSSYKILWQHLFPTISSKLCNYILRLVLVDCVLFLKRITVKLSGVAVVLNQSCFCLRRVGSVKGAGAAFLEWANRFSFCVYFDICIERILVTTYGQYFIHVVT